MRVVALAMLYRDVVIDDPLEHEDLSRRGAGDRRVDDLGVVDLRVGGLDRPLEQGEGRIVLGEELAIGGVVLEEDLEERCHVERELLVEDVLYPARPCAAGAR